MISLANIPIFSLHKFFPAAIFNMVANLICYSGNIGLTRSLNGVANPPDSHFHINVVAFSYAVSLTIKNVSVILCTTNIYNDRVFAAFTPRKYSTAIILGDLIFLLSNR